MKLNRLSLAFIGVMALTCTKPGNGEILTNGPSNSSQSEKKAAAFMKDRDKHNRNFECIDFEQYPRIDGLLYEGVDGIRRQVIKAVQCKPTDSKPEDCDADVMIDENGEPFMAYWC